MVSNEFGPELGLPVFLHHLTRDIAAHQLHCYLISPLCALMMSDNVIRCWAGNLSEFGTWSEVLNCVAARI